MLTRLSVATSLVASLVISFAVASPVSAESGGGTTTATAAAMGQIAAGDRTNCTIVSERVACWGENGRGQIGDGTTTQRALATYVPGLTGVQSIAVSDRNTCVIVTGGGVKCWGDNTYGQLGNGAASSSNTTSPTSVCAVGGCGSGTLTGATQISMGFGFACALLGDGTVNCWGYNNVYQLGATSPSTSTLPITVSGVTGASSIASGREHTCVIVSGGSMKCWGEGQYGRLGDGGTSKSTLVNVNRAGVSSVTAIAATNTATCAIVAASKVKCWGGDAANEMGYSTGGDATPNVYDSNLSTTFPTQTPVTPRLGGVDLTAKAIDGGPHAVCIISLTDSLACWGSIAGLGIATGGTNFGSAFSSNWVSGMTSTTNVAVSTSTVCATNAATLKCWGAGPFGELGDNNASGGSSPSAAVNVVGLITQTVSFPTISTKSTSDSPFTLVATSSSGQDVSFASLTPAVCDENQVGQTWSLSIIGAGSCTVDATAAGGMVLGTYFAPASASQTFTVTAVAPVVTLDAASSVTTTTASISATLNPALSSTTGSFRYATTEDLSGAITAGASTTAANAGTVSVSAALTGLSPGVKYFYTYQATNSVGTTSAPVRSFTMVGFAPTATSGSATSISSSRVTLNASVTPGGLDTTVWFTWGQKSDLSDGARAEYRNISDVTAVDVSVTVTGLTESTRYYYRIEASNGLGSVKGDIKSFTASRPLGISVNDAAEFTNKKQVTIYATGPSGSTQVIISNDGGFGSSQTFSLTDGYAEIPWTLVASRDERLPKTVYARFVQRFGTQSSTNTDDIILDTTAPVMTGTTGTSTSASSGNVTVQGVRVSAAGAVKLTVRAKDANSGIGKVQVKGSSGGRPVDVTTGSPKATTRTVKVNTTKKKLWVRVVDRAGNVSKWVIVMVK